MSILKSVLSELFTKSGNQAPPAGASHDDSSSSGEADSSTANVMEVVSEDTSFKYYTPNDMLRWRVQSLYTKEPSTIEWLRRLNADSVLLDVGANVGMYSIFAAATRGARVFAFEPESQNFSVLTKNIVLNELEELVTPFSIALSNKAGMSFLYLSKFSWNGGGSCHSLGEEVGFDLNPRQSPFAQGCASFTIDQAVEQGVIEVPNFIKIDVDGFEHLVIDGAMETLSNPRLRSLLIEINTNLEEHRQLVQRLQDMGFYYDPAQVDSVTRTEGAFTGCAEFIFDKVPAFNISIMAALNVDPVTEYTAKAFEHVLKKIEDCAISLKPFPHVVIDEIFPEDYYKQLLSNFPDKETLASIASRGRTTGYAERNVLLFKPEDFSRLNDTQRAFWLQFYAWLSSERFLIAVLKKLLPHLANRLARHYDNNDRLAIANDTLLVRDETNYGIGPHTDVITRLVSFLFYLPEDDRDKELGTSLYVPQEEGFICREGSHYKREGFDIERTIEFIPNRLVMFLRTDCSFHGVEKIHKEGVSRNLIINNLRVIDDAKK